MATYLFETNLTVEAIGQTQDAAEMALEVGTPAGDADSSEFALDVTTGEGVLVFSDVLSETIAGAR